MLFVNREGNTVIIQGDPSVAAAHLAAIGIELEFQSETPPKVADKLFRNAIATHSCSGGSSLMTARLLTGLSINLIEMGELNEAEGELKKALNIFASLPSDERPLDRIALARECLAQLYEEKNMPDMAIRTRAGGMANGEMRCSSRKCCKPPLTTDELNRCARCLSPWYCGKECQQNDWELRHKAECKHLRNAKAQTSQ